MEATRHSDSLGSGASQDWCFGEARFDARSLKLYVHGVPAELELKPLEVLRYLLRHAGKAVSKDELIKAVWPGRIISDSALTSTIAKLREALGDQQSLIHTVHGFGYRLEAAVRTDAGIRENGKVPGLAARTWTTLRARRAAALAAAAALLALGGMALHRSQPWQPVAAADKSVAVLPLTNLSGGTDSAYFVDGIHDAIITHLAQVKDLKTISRTSVMEFRDAKGSLRDVGARLGVAHVVEGSVQRHGQRVRVTMQLIQAENDRHLWAETYDRDIADLFAIQSDIAQRVATAVHASLTTDEAGRIARKPTEDAKAYDLYLRALAVWHDPHVLTAKELDDVIAVLDEAVRRDPGFALAYALLAHFHVARHWFLRNPESADLAARASERSLTLQPDLVEGLVARGHYVDWVLEDKDAAIDLYERARTLAPGNAHAVGWLALALVKQGRLEEALRAHEQAVLLAPLDAEIVREYAGTLMALRRYSEAERVYERAVTLGLEPWIMPLQKAYANFMRTGDMRLLESAFSGVGADDRFNMYFNTRRYFIALMLRNFPRAAEIALENEAQDVFVTFGAQPLSKHAFAAIAHMFGGDAGRAGMHARRAVEILEPQLRSAPGLIYTRLFLAYSLLAGAERERAVTEARRAFAEWQAMEPSPTAFHGLGSCFFAYVGDEATALHLLEKGLKVTRGVEVREVEHLPCFDRLRGHPRFRELVAAHQPGGA